MAELELPLILEPEALQAHLGAADLLLVDLCKPEDYAYGQIQGAVHLNYGDIVASRPPVGGLLPDDGHLSRLFSTLGLTPQRHVVAYDDEGGGRAARLLWTLDVIGHTRFSLLNGGRNAWVNAGFTFDQTSVTPEPSNYTAVSSDVHRADKDYILANLARSDVVLLDARTPEEYAGMKRFSARGGHIPGAKNMDWVRAMDFARDLRLRSEPELRQMLDGLGIGPDSEVITYCQTHHRSSHTYIVLKALGFTRIKGYPGAWSEWGNLSDTPVESGV